MTEPPITDEEMQRMPWTRGLMTREEFVQWLESRKDAGAAIDVEACEIGCWSADGADPYGRRHFFPSEYDVYFDNFNLVRSAKSNGWVCECDLPVEKWKVLDARIHRQYEAANPEIIF